MDGCIYISLSLTVVLGGNVYVCHKRQNISEDSTIKQYQKRLFRFPPRLSHYLIAVILYTREPTVVIVSDGVGEGRVVSPGRVGHCSHKQLPRRSSEPPSVVILLQPLGQDLPETALNIATVCLDGVNGTRMESQGQTQTFPLRSNIAELRVDLKQVVDVWRTI